MTLLYLSIVVATVLGALVRRRDLLSPVRIYIIIYSTLLAVYSLKLSRFQTPWSQTTHLLFWGAHAAFIGGAVMIGILYKIRNPEPSAVFGDIRQSVVKDVQSINWNWFFGVWGIVSFVFLSSYFSAVLQTGVIPAFAESPNDARMDFVVSNKAIMYGWFLGPICLMLAIELMMFSPLRGRKRIFLVAVTGITFLCYLFLTMRLDLFRLVIFFMVLYHYCRKPLSFKSIALIALCVVSIVMFAFIIRLNYQGAELLATTFKIRMPRQYIWASSMYAYVVNNFWNLNYAFQKYIDGVGCYPFSFGFETFRPLTFLLRISESLQQSYRFDSPYNESIVMLSGLNTVIYIWHFYKDFGILGVYLLSLVGGIAVSLFYYNFISHSTLLRCGILSVFLSFIIMSFMVPLWSFWSVYLNIGILILAHRPLCGQLALNPSAKRICC